VPAVECRPSARPPKCAGRRPCAGAGRTKPDRESGSSEVRPRAAAELNA
jgi:hypothetical protein